ncbi:MAG: TetR/AcrR family transcriptional regulator [Candidatus Omnitrophica bacterium]|nr:TetR/AcrR family transcriptional regulator [Candidatus Omnitrophota bacterium]
MKAVQERSQKTRSNIIQAAFDLFHEQGVNATSVDEILKESGAGKSQFYHYFKSKDDLIHEVVKSFSEKLRSKKLPVKYDIESWDDLEQWFYFFVNFQKSVHCERGCPMATIGYELTNDQELIRQDINLIFEFTKNSLSRFFHGLKAKGKLKKSADPDALADFCFSIMQGGMITAKIKKETTPFENAVHHAIIYLKSLTR